MKLWKLSTTREEAWNIPPSPAWQIRPRRPQAKASLAAFWETVNQRIQTSSAQDSPAAESARWQINCFKLLHLGGNWLDSNMGKRWLIQGNRNCRSRRSSTEAKNRANTHCKRLNRAAFTEANLLHECAVKRVYVWLRRWFKVRPAWIPIPLTLQ